MNYERETSERTWGDINKVKHHDIIIAKKLKDRETTFSLTDFINVIQYLGNKVDSLEQVYMNMKQNKKLQDRLGKEESRLKALLEDVEQIILQKRYETPTNEVMNLKFDKCMKEYDIIKQRLQELRTKKKLHKRIQNTGMNTKHDDSQTPGSEYDKEFRDEDEYGIDKNEQLRMRRKEEELKLTSWQTATLEIERKRELESNSMLHELKVEQDELHSYYVDLKELVDRQGIQLNQIENNVDDSVDHVEQAVQDMKLV